jgi:hypothetical protein
MVQPFIQQLSTNLVASATAAVAVEPNLADAFFVRGWGEFIVDPTSAAAKADVAKAAGIDPTDAFFAASAALLK